MSMSAGIGQSIRIKGEVTAREPFLVSGHVEGTIAVDGHPLTVSEGATVDATIVADTAVIQGHVKGDLTATAKIVVQSTATLEGEFSAPTISIAEGATIHGKVETTSRKPKLAAAV